MNRYSSIIIFIFLFPITSHAGINKSFFSINLSSNDISSNVSATHIGGNAAIGNITTSSSLASNHSSSNYSPSISVYKNLSLSNLSFLGLRLLTPKFKKTFLNFEAFYDHLSNSKSYNATTQVNGNNIAFADNINLLSRYGFKAGLGYEFNKTFSSYFNIGLSSLDYEIDNRSNSQLNGLGASNQGRSHNNRTFDLITSIGLTYNMYNYLTLGLEYSVQNSDLKSADFVNAAQPGILNINYDTKIESITFKVSKKL